MATFAQHGTEIKVRQRTDIAPNASGRIHTSTVVKIPEGHIGLLAVRQSYGDLDIQLTSPILWAGFEGCPTLYLKNAGANVAEFRAGEKVAHLAILKAFDGVVE